MSRFSFACRRSLLCVGCFPYPVTQPTHYHPPPTTTPILYHPSTRGLSLSCSWRCGICVFADLHIWETRKGVCFLRQPQHVGALEKIWIDFKRSQWIWNEMNLKCYLNWSCLALVLYWNFLFFNKNPKIFSLYNIVFLFKQFHFFRITLTAHLTAVHIAYGLWHVERVQFLLSFPFCCTKLADVFQFSASTVDAKVVQSGWQ